MKKFKKMLCLLLAVVLLACALPAAAFADELTAMPAELDVYRSGDGSGGFEATVDGREMFGVETIFGTSRSQSPSADSCADMYRQLSERQKLCYTALENIHVADLLTTAQVEYQGNVYYRVKVNIDGITGVSMKGAIEGGSFIPSAADAKSEVEIYTDLCAAIVALRYDTPEDLWMRNMRYGYKMEQTGNNSVKITDVMFDFHLEFGGEEVQMVSDVKDAAGAICSEAANQPDTYSKVKVVHDILVKNNTYGDVDGSLSHTAYSALIADEIYPVCDGYSKAFKCVMDMLEIPCALVSSETHMWNAVQMDDGEWYYIDITWDDTDSEKINYDYFLVGSETVIDGKAFSKQSDHVILNPYEPYYSQDPTYLNLVTLRFPAVSAEAYSYIGAEYTPPTFPDVKRSAWYFEPVESAAARGLFVGDEYGNFLPRKNITRAEFAKVTALSLGVDLTVYQTAACTFTDVKNDAWYYSAAAWAEETGLMKGYTDGSFKPNAPITRQEMCVVLYNAMSNKYAPTGHLFADDAGIAQWAKQAVYSCHAAGLVQGDPSGNFTPRDNTLRCQAAVVFTNFVNLGENPDTDVTE